MGNSTRTSKLAITGTTIPRKRQPGACTAWNSSFLHTSKVEPAFLTKGRRAAAKKFSFFWVQVDRSALLMLRLNRSAVLTRTFMHIPGVGPKTERSLWEQGCADWDCFLGSTYDVNQVPYETARLEIETSKTNLEQGVHQYFSRALGVAEAWREFPEFRSRAVYL